MTTIEETLKNYIALNKRLKKLNGERKELLEVIGNVKADIFTYIKEQQVKALQFGGCTIKLCRKKIYEKESVKDRLNRKLDSNQVEKIVEILNDKKFDEIEDLHIRLG